MNQKKYFRAFVFILIIVSLDQVSGTILRRLYFSQKNGQNYALTFVFSNCSSPVIVFGNSRAQHHYDPSILANSLGMRCFNAGQDGGHSILLAYAQIQVLLNRYLPKIIILEFDPLSIESRPEDYAKLSILLPYCKPYPEIDTLVWLRVLTRN